jgi:glycosyltransferase involved in cell wall biosynthesis
MNIWILNHYAHPPDIPGSTRHYDFARELIKHGHKVIIFSSSFNHFTRRDDRLSGKLNYRMENIDGVEFIWLRTSPYYGGNDWRRVVNMLSYAFRVIPPGMKLKEKPDVVLASSPHPFAGLAGWLLAKLKGAAFIFEVMDLWPQTLVDIGGYSGKSPVVVLLRILERFLYRTADRIVVLHPKASDYIIKLRIASTKVVYIPIGPSPELFSESSAQLPQDLNDLISSLKSSGKFLAVYAGALGIANALDTVIDTAKLLQDEKQDKIHFLLVGEGPEKQNLIEKTKNQSLSNIGFYCSIPKDAVPRLLFLSDITIMSWKNSSLYTRYGMSSNKLWDYMMAARPVVWAINSANDPVAEAGCGITVPPEDPDSMARAIITLCDMTEEERRQMGLRGYEYVLKYHSLPLLADRLIRVIQDATRK